MTEGHPQPRLAYSWPDFEEFTVPDGILDHEEDCGHVACAHCGHQPAVAAAGHTWVSNLAEPKPQVLDAYDLDMQLPQSAQLRTDYVQAASTQSLATTEQGSVSIAQQQAGLAQIPLTHPQLLHPAGIPPTAIPLTAGLSGLTAAQLAGLPPPGMYTAAHSAAAVAAAQLAHQRRSAMAGHLIPRQRTSPPGGNINKARVRWTPELHARFVESVSLLGGPDRATPKGILRQMQVEGMTIYHIKSHLQKYRLQAVRPAGQKTPADANGTTGAAPGANDPTYPPLVASNAVPLLDKDVPVAPAVGSAAGPSAATTKPADVPVASGEVATPSTSLGGPDVVRTQKIEEALMKQMDMQKQLHKQLEQQRDLQLSLEAHGKYLQTMIEEQRHGKGGKEEAPTAPPEAEPE
ncbi:hypothetical protein CYMTET_42644 [Cymbomonas tetramitiformis]|uniref:HTH myb-type domain-containing protein n=1 Tax=Cymbomonas tetramitiformis TaxID=36881 RepID=A0AAE0C3S6_9CHLO|nr:hypothetical protein CYMTET_42644 [Cymbomonas tetramitiformis]